MLAKSYRLDLDSNGAFLTNLLTTPNPVLLECCSPSGATRPKEAWMLMRRCRQKSGLVDGGVSLVVAGEFEIQVVDPVRQFDRYGIVHGDVNLFPLLSNLHVIPSQSDPQLPRFADNFILNGLFL